MWFLGLYEWLGGRPDPDWAVLARSSVIGVTASVALALTTQVAGYRRQVGRLLEIQDAGSRPLAPLRAIGAAVAEASSGAGRSSAEYSPSQFRP